MFAKLTADFLGTVWLAFGGCSSAGAALAGGLHRALLEPGREPDVAGR